ncbi:MAG: alpha/beta hydrolase [Gemmatimonadaceae bacterium]
MSGTITVRRAILVLTGVVALAAAVYLVRGKAGPHPERMAARLPEQLVFARASDDIVDAGAMFSPGGGAARPVAIIWVHGWGVNFYQPSYVQIARALAERGYTVVSVNTRMHDLGNVEGYRWGKRLRGGGYWGVASDEVRDLAGWIDFVEGHGFRKTILVGHSAGWAAVRRYQADTQDPRVAGVVLASGAVRPETRPTDPDQLAEAKRLMDKGEGDALIRDPKRSFPSYISAATFLDIANAPPAYRDFFGVKSSDAPVVRIHCPLLAFFGTNGDVGTEEDLTLLKAAIQRQKGGPGRVTTVMIHGADHMYTGEETQVAQAIADWIGTL